MRMKWFAFAILLLSGAVAHAWSHGTLVGAPGFEATCSSKFAAAPSTPVPCPPGTAFRDFSSMTPHPGNPIWPQGPEAYTAGGVSAPYFTPYSKIGSTYYAMANCTNAGVNRSNWPQLCLYAGPSILELALYPTGNPVVTAQGGWNAFYLLHPVIAPTCSVANWCAYFSANNGSGVMSIGMVTSPDLITWTHYGTSNLIGPNGSNVTAPGLPWVIQIGDLLYLYCSNDGNSSRQIVYYTSPITDGINWTYGGVALPEPLSTDWDYGTIGNIDVFVFRNSHGFYEMSYSAIIAYQQVGYAVSADGINWWKKQDAPILTPDQAGYPNKYIGDIVFHQDGTTFYAIGNWDDGSIGSEGFALTMPDR